MSPQEKYQIIKTSQDLKLRQEQKQDVNILPTVTIGDIPRDTPKTEIRKKQENQFWVPQPTNGLAFFRTLVPIPSLPKDLVPYIPLFTTALTSMGTQKRDYRELAHEIELFTGGLTASSCLVTSPSNLNEMQAYVLFSAMALERNVQKMFEILSEIVTSPNFENIEFLRTLLLQRTANLQDSLISDGHAYAQTYSASPFRKSTELNETWHGISQLNFIQPLSVQDNLSPVVDKLKQLADIILKNSASRVMITAEERLFPALSTHVSNFLSNQSLATPTSNLGNSSQEKSQNYKTFFTVPGQVNYVAESLPTVPYIHQDSPSLQILARLLSRVYLHREIREKGGAYGGGVSSNVGLWQYYSYRDPHVIKTLQNFRNSIEWFLKGDEFSDQDVEEAKLTVFADLDAPVPPSDKGFLEFSKGITWEMRQKRREEYFKITRKELKEVAEKYLVGKSGSIAVVGSEEAAETIKSDSTWEFR